MQHLVELLVPPERESGHPFSRPVCDVATVLLSGDLSPTTTVALPCFL